MTPEASYQLERAFKWSEVFSVMLVWKRFLKSGNKQTMPDEFLFPAYFLSATRALVLSHNTYRDF
jgi:hypothetical protein